MQVARNFFLTREKTITRKLREVLLAWKIEANLSKDEILELYVNQIFLGQRAYGFAAASQIYFGKPLQGRHRRRGGDAGRPAQGAVGLQPRHQPETGQDAPAVRTAADARAQLHQRRAIHAKHKMRHWPSGRGCAKSLPDARRVRRRDGAAGGVRRLRRGGVHQGHDRLDHDPQGRPGSRLCCGAARRDRLRPPARLPRARRPTSTCPDDAAEQEQALDRRLPGDAPTATTSSPAVVLEASATEVRAVLASGDTVVRSPATGSSSPPAA